MQLDCRSVHSSTLQQCVYGTHVGRQPRVLATICRCLDRCCKQVWLPSPALSSMAGPCKGCAKLQEGVPAVATRSTALSTPMLLLHCWWVDAQLTEPCQPLPLLLPLLLPPQQPPQLPLPQPPLQQQQQEVATVPHLVQCVADCQLGCHLGDGEACGLGGQG